MTEILVLGKDLLYIIANYIGIDDNDTIIIKKSSTNCIKKHKIKNCKCDNFYGENAKMKMGEFSVISFCEIYQLDLRKIEGKIFNNFLKKLRAQDMIIDVPELQLLDKIYTNDIETNIIIRYIYSLSKAQYEFNNMNIKLYDFQKNNNLLFDIYDYYDLLQFTDLTRYSFFTYNKYIDDNYNKFMYKKYRSRNIKTKEFEISPPEMYTYIKCKESKDSKEIDKYIEEHNKFYKFIEKYFIVRKDEFEKNINEFTNGLLTLFKKIKKINGIILLLQAGQYLIA